MRRHEFVSLASRSTCTYCDATAEYMGVDRVQNDQSYALGNVVPCCATSNSVKGKCTLRSFVERTRMIGHKFGHLQQRVAAWPLVVVLMSNMRMASGGR